MIISLPSIQNYTADGPAPVDEFEDSLACPACSAYMTIVSLGEDVVVKCDRRNECGMTMTFMQMGFYISKTPRAKH